MDFETDVASRHKASHQTPSMKRRRGENEQPARSAHTSGAFWLTSTTHSRELLARISDVAWDGSLAGLVLDDHSTKFTPAVWELPECQQHSADWIHELCWCPRPEGSFAIHRFRPRPGTSSVDLSALRAHARQEMADNADGTAVQEDTASNIGGYHGTREAWWREEVTQTGLPYHIGCAVRQSAHAEALALRRPVITACPDEAWFNVLGAGAWNCLHTHPGSAYSGVYYVDDGGGMCDDRCQSREGSILSGRLAFVCQQPDLLAEYHRDSHLQKPDEPQIEPRALQERCQQRFMLLIDPIPGTCIVFPSFVPHCVLPAAMPTLAPADTGSASVLRRPSSDLPDDLGAKSAAPTSSGADPTPLRVSLAFNFGASDPVLANTYTLPGGGACAPPRVKLLLETVPIFGLARSSTARIDGSDLDDGEYVL